MTGIISAMLANGQRTILITRLGAEAAAQIAQTHPLDYRAEARVGIIGPMPEPDGLGTIVVATGGTSGHPRGGGGGADRRDSRQPRRAAL